MSEMRLTGDRFECWPTCRQSGNAMTLGKLFTQAAQFDISHMKLMPHDWEGN